MRTRLLQTACLLLALGACGGFDNRPLGEGVVRGRLTGADREVAEVFVFGEPDGRRASVEDDGTFELEHVGAGPVELYVRGSDTAAVRLKTEVQGGMLTELGEVALEPAAVVTVRLLTPAGQDPRRGRVWLDEVLRSELRVEEEGEEGEQSEEATVSLAGGCYTVRAQLEGFADASGRFCVSAGEASEVPLLFPVPDMRDGREGCLKSGCLEGLACMSDGACR